MGATPEAVATAMVEAGADAVGANCGVGVELSVEICRRLRAACDLPLWIKPNAGLPTMEGAAVRYATSAEFFASHYQALPGGRVLPGRLLRLHSRFHSRPGKCKKL